MATPSSTIRYGRRIFSAVAPRTPERTFGVGAAIRPLFTRGCRLAGATGIEARAPTARVLARVVRRWIVEIRRADEADWRTWGEGLATPWACVVAGEPLE
jgi:hypothetical protein